jgi:hypothetical protein
VSLAEKQNQLLQNSDKRRDQLKKDVNALVGEDEKSRILRMIVDEDSEDDESSQESSSDSNENESPSGSSIVSEQDLLNRSIESENNFVVNSGSFLRYANEKYN